MIVAVDNDAEGGCVLGFCGVKRGTSETEDVEDTKVDVWSIWRLSVSEDARGTGLGKGLMSRSEEWARTNGGRKIVLYTGNDAASKFYQKIGYAKTSSFRHEKKLVE